MLLMTALKDERVSSFISRGRHNKSMDVRAKQRLCYLACLFSLNLRVAVSPHVISAFRPKLLRAHLQYLLLLNVLSTTQDSRVSDFSYSVTSRFPTALTRERADAPFMTYARSILSAARFTRYLSLRVSMRAPGLALR